MTPEQMLSTAKDLAPWVMEQIGKGHGLEMAIEMAIVEKNNFYNKMINNPDFNDACFAIVKNNK